MTLALLGGTQGKPCLSVIYSIILHLVMIDDEYESRCGLITNSFHVLMFYEAGAEGFDVAS